MRVFNFFFSFFEHHYCIFFILYSGVTWPLLSSILQLDNSVCKCVYVCVGVCLYARTSGVI